MRKMWLLILTAMAILSSAGCADRRNGSDFETERTFFAMDTAISFKGDAKGAERAEKLISELDMLFDRYSEESDVYKLNSRQNTACSDYTREIITLSQELTEKYGSGVSIFAGDITDCWNIGAESPVVPEAEEIKKALDSFEKADFSLDTMSFADENGSIDLGSVAKGYALDKVYGELGSEDCYIVSAESSVLLCGEKPDGSDFTVSLRDPENSSAIIGSIKTKECFLSTSGGSQRYFEADGRRYSHIFDLNTGRPSETELTSVTVMCSSGIESDFLATLIYTEGKEYLGKYLNNDALKIIAVTSDKEIFLSDGVDFELSADCGYEIKEYSHE